MANLANQCWALAGITQAATQVQATALGKALNEDAVLALYKALLAQQASSMEELVHLGDFSLGLATAAGMLHRPNEEQIQSLRYVLAIIDATGRLRKRERAVTRLADGLLTIDGSEIDTPGFCSFDMPWQELADIYVDTLGSLNQRVQVRGSPATLQRRDVASKIRGLLLMGVRFAWLWHQLGGRRWHLLVNRRRMWQTTQLLAQLEPPGEQL